MSLLLGSPCALAQDDDNFKLWDQFAHFVLVAQPNLAAPLGEQLLALDNAEFLAAIEADVSRDFVDLEDWMSRNDQLSDLWDRLDEKHEAALTERSRDEAQIRSDIEALGQGQRAYNNAVARLQVTGQYAAPLMLEYLQNDRHRALHPRLIDAMQAVGVELVYPLSLALPHLDAATQGKVAVVLGNIGYPEALPYLRTVMDDPDTAPTMKATCGSAFRQILANTDLSANATAAQLHLSLGEGKYAAGTRGNDLVGLDLATDQGIIWRYNADAGLIMIPVPRQIHADVLAMQNARFALMLDPEYTEAVTLHLAANVRRENNLGNDADISYKLSNPASFYLLLAGPDQQKAVLSRALDNADSAQALVAIEAMAKTVGNTVLLDQGGARQPVLESLFYADRRVRYNAAITLAQAAPSDVFPGSVSVVPVLGQALRQSETLNAMVVAPDGSLDTLVASLEEIDFNAAGAANLDQANEIAANAFPGVDVIVYSGDLLSFRAFYEGAKEDGMLSIAPILAMVTDNVASAIRLEFPDVITTAKLSAEGGSDEIDRLERLANEAVLAYGGEPIGADESLAFAETAVGLLHTIATTPSIYDIADAETVLIGALDDDRPSIAVGAGQVLAVINTPEAQQGLAAAALSRRGDVQIALLNSLAESAKDFQNMLSRDAVGSLVQLVQTADGETALAAARALGALTDRPTGDTTGFILGS
ncbi:MAG: hypothetical protein ACIAXF_05840 [Phycisphaerales bacterium JB063]